MTRSSSKFNADFNDLTDLIKQGEGQILYIDKGWSENDLNIVEKLCPDFIFCVGWSFLLPKQLVELPNKATIGYHPASLPLNRGRHPIIWALVLGLTQTASSFFVIDEGVDNGPIVHQIKIPITQEDNALSLYQKLLDVIPFQIHEIVKKFQGGGLQLEIQDEASVNYWRKRVPDDGIIDWRMSATGIHNLIRALSRPYSGAEFKFKQKLIKVWSSKVIENTEKNIEPGKILSRCQKGVVVKCGQDSILILDVEHDLELNPGEYL